MTLSRRDVFTRGGALGIGATAGLPFAAGSLAAPPRQEGSKKVIFVTHDDNPFFVPVRAGLEQFGALAGWETQWVGPPKHDEVATLQYQLDAIAAKPAKEITGRDDGIIILGTIAPGHSALDARMEGARQGIAQYNEENGTSYTTEDMTTSTDPAEAISKL